MIREHGSLVRANRGFDQAEQRELRRLAGCSRLRMLELDVTDGDVARSAEMLVDWMEETGGLYQA